MKKNVITISREFGSGGHTIGLELSKQLGIEFYDQELIEKMSDQSGLTTETISGFMNEAPRINRYLYSFIGREYKGMSIPDYLWHIEAEVIREVAEKSPCVIVGRCADFLLKDRDDVFSVFIYADPEKRAQRIVERFGETDEPPKKRLEEKDKNRAAHYRYYTGQKYGKAQNYNLCLDSGEIGIEKCVAIIKDLVE